MKALDHRARAGRPRVEQLDRRRSIALTDGIVDLAHRAAAEHDPEPPLAELLAGPATFVDAALARRIVGDFGECLLAIADDPHRALQLGERGCRGPACPAAN